MFRVICLGIWWYHDIWISKKLKFDYLKKEKSFRSEIKNIFLVSQVLAFRHTKQNSKNVADTTFKNTFFYRTPPMTASGCLRLKDNNYSGSYEYLLKKTGSPTMAVKQLPELRIPASKILSLWKKQFITLNFQLIICRFILLIHQNMEAKSLKFLWDTYRTHCLKLWKRKCQYKIFKKN